MLEALAEWSDKHDLYRGLLQMDGPEVKSRIGVLPEGMRLFERLSGRELLGYMGRLRGLPGEETDKRATQLLEVYRKSHPRAHRSAE